MDPNAVLKRIRELVKKSEGGELASRIQSLDCWISTGGFLPDAWKEKDPVFPQLRVPLRKEQEQE